MPEQVQVLLVAPQRARDAVERALVDAGEQGVECDTVPSHRSLIGALTPAVDVVLAVHDPPESDGMQAVQAAAERAGAPPVVVLGSDVPVERALAAGAADVLDRGVLDTPPLLVRRLRTVAAAHQNRQVRRVVDESLPGIVYRCRNAPDWPFEFLSDGCRALTGYPADRVLDGDVSWGEDVIHPDDQGWVWETVQAALDAGESFQLTYRIQTAAGDRKWVWERGRQTDAGVLAGVITDVTPYREREERIEDLLDATRELMRGETREQIATAAVEAARDVLGLPLSGVHLREEPGGGLLPVATTDRLEELLGGEPAYHPEGHPERTAGDGLVLEAFESGETVVVSDTREHERARERETPARSVIIHPLGDHGVFVTSSVEPDAFDEVDVSLASLLAATLETALDRAEREQELRERQLLFERQNERLEEFAAVVSHDLRNPLNIAQGNVELARQDGDLSRLDAVTAAHDRMARLITDLLALARQGRHVGDPSPVDPAGVARSAWATVDTADATLELGEFDPVLADRERFVSLLENLFRNSVEHGGPNVTVRIEPTPDGFAVADDGPGITESERDQVFERGYTTSESGTGFGLAIVRNIAEAHGWSVAVTESDTGGARFVFSGVERAASGTD